MNIAIQTIPHAEQRYPTAGDWIEGDGGLIVSVGDMGNDDFAFLVGLHEMIEGWLCRRRGIDQARVDAFDVAFEAARRPGNTDEPGDHPDAPYRREHFFATSIERLMAAELGVDWGEYERAVNALG